LKNSQHYDNKEAQTCCLGVVLNLKETADIGEARKISETKSVKGTLKIEGSASLIGVPCGRPISHKGPSGVERNFGIWYYT